MQQVLKILFLIILFCSLPVNIYPLKFDLFGKVETIRKDKTITLLFDEKPKDINYIIIEDDLQAGRLQIISITSFIKNKKTIYRALARYSTDGNHDLVKSGSLIGLIEEDKEPGPDPKGFKERTVYKNIIISDIDYREMILIPSGKFIFGSDNGDKDEKPRQILTLDEYYIDKYEVSNSDYYSFINKTNSKSPASWTNGIYNDNEKDFPVIVSYYEAARYAEWAGKRLPTEEEWEKAARGTGIDYMRSKEGNYITLEKPVTYPWGNEFDPVKANSVEFWNDSSNITKELKNKYTKGLLPVYSFKDIGDSVYGIVNMAGNASEWTSSWYTAYKGSRYSDKMFGRQVKVIRGGAWFSDREKLRTTSREIGGLPNLYDDSIAGFRCVKEPTIVDESKAE